MAQLHLPTVEQEPLQAEPASSFRAGGSPFSTLKLSSFFEIGEPPVSPSRPVKKAALAGNGHESRARRAGSVTYGDSGLKSEEAARADEKGHEEVTLTTSSTAASLAAAHLQPFSGPIHAPSSTFMLRQSEDGPGSVDLSRTGSSTSSGGVSSASSSDYLATPAQHPSGFEPRIVRGSPWSQFSREGPPPRLSAERRREHQPSPPMVDPRFQLPMKRGSLTKPVAGAHGLGLRMSSEQARSESAGSYVASLGMAPLLDGQGHQLPLYPSTSPYLSSTSSPSSSPELSRSLPLPSAASPPHRLLSAFQPQPTAASGPRRKSPPRKRSSPKSRASKQRRVSSPTSASRRRRHDDSGGSRSGSSTDHAGPSSSAMRPSPSAPNLHTPPRTRIHHSSRPAQQPQGGILRPAQSFGPIPSRAPTPASTYDAYFRPRPRLTPAGSQAPSASQLQAEWRRRRAIAQGEAPEPRDVQLAQEEDESNVRRVLRENEESRRERAAWSDSNAHSMGFSLARKMSFGGGMRRRSKSISRCQHPPPNEWEADSDAEAVAAARRRKEKQRVRLEREQRARRQAAAGSDTEQEDRPQTGDEGGYLDPYYSPPTARSFDPFAHAAADAASPIKGLVRKLSGSRSRRRSKSRDRRKASDAGLSSDGGAPKLSTSSWSSRGRRSSEAPPPLPGLAHSSSLADFNASGPLRFVGNRPIRHLRTSPSLDSLSPRHTSPTALPETVIGEALSDLSGAALHGRKMSVTEPAPTNVKQNAALSLPPHLHHLLRSPTAPATRTLEEHQDVGFLPTRAPPAVPGSDSGRTTTSQESATRISNDSGARLAVALDQKLSAEATETAQALTSSNQAKGKENARPVSDTPSIATLAIHSTDVAPLVWRSRARSSSVDSLKTKTHPYSLGRTNEVFPTFAPTSRHAQTGHGRSLAPPPRSTRLSKQSTDLFPRGLTKPTTVGSTVASSVPISLDPTATPTLGTKRTDATNGAAYFELPTAARDVRGLGMTSDDPFAPRNSLESHRAEEEPARVLPDSPASPTSSGGDSAGQFSVLEIEDGEAQFDSLFFRPPPTEADRSILPTPTPISLHRLSGSSRITASTFEPLIVALPLDRGELDRDARSQVESREIAFVDDGEGSQRRSWHSDEHSDDNFQQGDETFGIGARRQLRLSLHEGLLFDGDQDDRASTKQSDTWETATAEEGGASETEQAAEVEAQDHDQIGMAAPPSPQPQEEEPPTPTMRPGPSPAQGDWSATSFAREYFGSFSSQPASAPAEQSSFIDFRHSRDSRPVAISPTPTHASSAGSGRGSFLDFDEDADRPQDQRATESRSSFLEDWSPPSSPKRMSNLSLPVVLSAPVHVADGLAPSPSAVSSDQSRLSADSRRPDLGGGSNETSPALSPMAASFGSDARLSGLDDFPKPPHAASLLPEASIRRPRSMPQVFATHPTPPRAKRSSPLAVGDKSRRSSASFLDLREEGRRPLSLATTTSSIYSSSQRPTSDSSFPSFFSEGGDRASTMLERGFVFRLEQAGDH